MSWHGGLLIGYQNCSYRFHCRIIRCHLPQWNIWHCSTSHIIYLSLTVSCLFHDVLEHEFASVKCAIWQMHLQMLCVNVSITFTFKWSRWSCMDVIGCLHLCLRLSYPSRHSVHVIPCQEPNDIGGTMNCCGVATDVGLRCVVNVGRWFQRETLLRQNVLRRSTRFPWPTGWGLRKRRKFNIWTQFVPVFLLKLDSWAVMTTSCPTNLSTNKDTCWVEVACFRSNILTKRFLVHAQSIDSMQHIFQISL